MENQQNEWRTLLKGTASNFVGSFASGLMILLITILLKTTPAPTQDTPPPPPQITIVHNGDVNFNLTLIDKSNNVESQNVVPQPKLGGTPKKNKKSSKKRH